MATTYQPATPSQLTKAAIQRLAEALARQLGLRPGDELTPLIRGMGGSVDVEDTLLSDPTQTGSLYVDGAKKFRIIVPSHTSPERNRFTVAHEFGHFVLHYMWKRQQEADYPEKVMAFRRGSERIEWEANWFAGAFLMPEGPFRELYEQEDGDLEAIAEHFRVSIKAAEVRAKDLGLR